MAFRIRFRRFRLSIVEFRNFQRFLSRAFGQHSFSPYGIRIRRLFGLFSFNSPSQYIKGPRRVVRTPERVKSRVGFARRSVFFLGSVKIVNCRRHAAARPRLFPSPKAKRFPFKPSFVSPFSPRCCATVRKRNRVHPSNGYSPYDTITICARRLA